MFILTPDQALVFFIILIIVGIIKWISSIDLEYHVCPKAFKEGWAEPFCRAMIERDMIYGDDEWIPKYDKDDRDSEELKAKLLKKDIALNKQGKWWLTGETNRKVVNEIYNIK